MRTTVNATARVELAVLPLPVSDAGAGVAGNYVSARRVVEAWG